MIKLYSAYSEVNEFHGYDGVRVNWQCIRREHSVVRHDQVIQDYWEVETAQRYRAGDYVDGLLTMAEIEELRRHLVVQHGVDADVAQEIGFPVDPVDVDLARQFEDEVRLSNHRQVSEC